MDDAYEFISKCTYSKQYLKEFKDGMLIGLGCSCEEACSDEEICICLAQHPCSYTNDGILKDMDANEPAYECNECCSCPSNCSNRLVQNKSEWKLSTFQTQRKGIGLKTTQFIPAMAFVVEYIGEVITSSEALLRSTHPISMQNNYLLTSREYFGSTIHKHHIDAREKGNNARFINHSCQPNLFMLPVRVDSSVPKIAFFSLRDIEVDEELTFDYGQNFSIKTTVENLSSFPREVGSTPCHCNTETCQKFLPYDKCLFE